MIFQPKQVAWGEGSYAIYKPLLANAHPCLNQAIFKELWNHFTLGASSLEITECEGLTLMIGEATPLPLEGYEYSISIEPRGICVSAEDKAALIRAFMTLLDQFKPEEVAGTAAVSARCQRIRDRADIGCRMVHFCVFPETELWELQRFLRFAAALKYTHVVLEFWGTLRLDCMSELSWPGAFNKEEVRPILSEAADLGLEIVPMFNHWGHASGSRIMHGKHVVLDQDPALATYFREDGWCWAIEKPKVRALLRRIRAELCELCGEGGYFHVGCDEAFSFEFTEEAMAFIADFLNEVAAEMRAEGRRTIMWGDMLLHRHLHYDQENVYTCNAPSPEAEQYLLKALDRHIIIADWQYDAKAAPVETALTLKAAGFDPLLCPWDKGEAQLNACIDTVKRESLHGILHTTWHTLTSGTPFVLLAAVRCHDTDNRTSHLEAYTKAAAILRGVMPAKGEYRRAGFARGQVGFRW